MKRVKLWVHAIDSASPVVQSKSLTFEAKIITVSDVVLNGCRGNIQDNYIINEGV